MTRAWPLVVLAIAACEPVAVPPMMFPTTPAPPPAGSLLLEDSVEPANACREQVVGLESWLRSLEQAGMPLSLSLIDEGAHLVERAGPMIDEPAPLVHLTAAELRLDGVPVADATALETDLTELIELRKSMMPESPFIQSPHCYLAIDREVPWRRVVEVAAVAAASGITKLTFVFGDQTRIVPRPPVSSIDRELDRMRQSTQLRRQQITAELLAWVYQDCAEGLRVIASMGINPVADFKQVILEQLPDAIGACRCAADDAAVKSLHWALFGNPRPTSGVSVDIASSDAAGATEIARGAEEPWSSAFERVVTLPAPPGAAPVRFTVEAVDEAQHRKTAGDRRGNGPGDRQVPRQ